MTDDEIAEIYEEERRVSPRALQLAASYGGAPQKYQRLLEERKVK